MGASLHWDPWGTHTFKMSLYISVEKLFSQIFYLDNLIRDETLMYDAERNSKQHERRILTRKLWLVMKT